MNQETKDLISLCLESLRRILIDEGVSIGMNNKDKKLIFFDTNTYIQCNKFDGFSVEIETLVK